MWMAVGSLQAQVQSLLEVERQKWPYDRKAKAISLEPGDLVLAKANAYRGRRKVKDQWEEEPYEVKCKVAEGIPSYLMRNQWTGHSWVLHQHWLFLIAPTEGIPHCMILHAEQARCITTTLEEQTLEDSETEEAPQGVNCPLLAQHQIGETPLGWVNSKLHAFIQMFPRASLLDKGWKVQCWGIGCVWTSMLAFQRQRYWSHQWGLKDITDHDFFNPTSLNSRDCNVTMQGLWNGCTSPCIFLGWLFWPSSCAFQRSCSLPQQCNPALFWWSHGHVPTWPGGCHQSTWVEPQTRGCLCLCYRRPVLSSCTSCGKS